MRLKSYLLLLNTGRTREFYSHTAKAGVDYLFNALICRYNPV